jgi:hypothetical protein
MHLSLIIHDDRVCQVPLRAKLKLFSPQINRTIISENELCHVLIIDCLWSLFYIFLHGSAFCTTLKMPYNLCDRLLCVCTAFYSLSLVISSRKLHQVWYSRQAVWVHMVRSAYVAAIYRRILAGKKKYVVDKEQRIERP